MGSIFWRHCCRRVRGIGFSYAATHANLASDNLSGGFLGSVASFATSGERSLEGENSDRVNFLILGVGGEGHDGPELADTIMFASFKPSDKSIGVLSIPRDLTVPIPGYGWRKINHANAFGESEKKGNGVELATKTIETLLKQKINYAVKVDFSGFEKIIDAVGVDVFVERVSIAIPDRRFPYKNGLISSRLATYGRKPRLNSCVQDMAQTARVRISHAPNGNNWCFSLFATACFPAARSSTLCGSPKYGARHPTMFPQIFQHGKPCGSLRFSETLRLTTSGTACSASAMDSR